jgi:peptidoglycan hydrolase CwlO-like protein
VSTPSLLHKKHGKARQRIVETMTETLESLLRDKDAELARLRAEISRMQRAVAATDKLQAANSEEVTSLTSQLAQAATVNK